MADPTGAERWMRLEHAYGAEWRARVQALALDFQQIVVAAATARIDEWSEEYWYVLLRNADDALFHVPPDNHEPYADAPNRFEQGGPSTEARVALALAVAPTHRGRSIYCGNRGAWLAVEELHVAIAAFLRAQRPATAGATPEPRASQLLGPQHFMCRFCGRRVVAGTHGEHFHFTELWEATSCAACHRERLRLEAQAERGTLLYQSWHRAAAVPPRCRKCGRVISDGGALGYDVEKLRAGRTCADCYMPF